jgi:hypothetical protein
LQEIMVQDLGGARSIRNQSLVFSSQRISSIGASLPLLTSWTPTCTSADRSVLPVSLPLIARFSLISPLVQPFPPKDRNQEDIHPPEVEDVPVYCHVSRENRQQDEQQRYETRSPLSLTKLPLRIFLLKPHLLCTACPTARLEAYSNHKVGRAPTQTTARDD